MIRIMIADDEPLIREGMAFLLGQEADFDVVGEAMDGGSAVSLAGAQSPDVILMDIEMPVCTGIEATAKIMTENPAVKIILLTTFDYSEYVYRGIRAGAVGYLLKDTDIEFVATAIRSIMQGATMYSSSNAAQVMQQLQANSQGFFVDRMDQKTLMEPLTERELEVLQLMADGLKNSVIAAQLYISEGTVKTHVHRIIQKLEVEDRTQAVVFALRKGLVH